MSDINNSLSKLSKLINSEMILPNESELKNYDDGSFLNLSKVVTSETEADLTSNNDITLNEQKNDEEDITLDKDLNAVNLDNKNSEYWQEVIKKELEEFTVIKNNDSILDKDNLNIDLDKDFGFTEDQLLSDFVKKVKEDNQELENPALNKGEEKPELAQQIDNIADDKLGDKENKKILSNVNEEQVMLKSINNQLEPQEIMTEKDASSAEQNKISDQLISDDIISSSKEKINNLRKRIAKNDELNSPYNLDLSLIIKPMIKEWLEDNLPIIVEKIVRKEIKKITE